MAPMRTRTRATFLLGVALGLAMTGCRYHARERTNLSEGTGCRSHCAHVHQKCVEDGEARRLGLDGVTYDLCRRELEDCTAHCRSATTAIARKDPPPPPADGLGWEPSDSVIECPFGLGSLSVPSALAPQVRRIDLDELQIDLSPEAILKLQSGRGKPPPMLEEWLSLHVQLTGTKQENLEVNVRPLDAPPEGWSVEYSISEGTTQTSFQAAARLVRRGDRFCRVIAVQRADVSEDQSAMRLLQSFVTR
jgi:hypothetical protein